MAMQGHTGSGQKRNKRRKEIDREVFFKGYEDTTLVDHLGNPLGSIGR